MLVGLLHWPQEPVAFVASQEPNGGDLSRGAGVRLPASQAGVLPPIPEFQAAGVRLPRSQAGVRPPSAAGVAAPGARYMGVLDPAYIGVLLPLKSGLAGCSRGGAAALAGENTFPNIEPASLHISYKKKRFHNQLFLGDSYHSSVGVQLYTGLIVEDIFDNSHLAFVWALADVDSLVHQRILTLPMFVVVCRARRGIFS